MNTRVQTPHSNQHAFSGGRRLLAAGVCCLLIALSLGRGFAADDTNQAVVADESGNRTSVTGTPTNSMPSSVLRGKRGDSKPSSTNAPASSRDFSSFRLVSDRNIFNANRSGGRPAGPSRPSRAPKKTDTLALVGIVSYERGTFALFDGSSSDFRKSIPAGSAVAGWKLKAVDSKSVQLESNGKTLEMHVSSQLKREDGGEWRLSTDAGSYRTGSSGSSDSATTGTASVGAGTPASSDAGSDEVLKRLLEKREKEMNR
jgi:hypothetical protein